MEYTWSFQAGKLLNNANCIYKRVLEGFWLVFCTFRFLIFVIPRKAMCFCLHVDIRQLQQLATAGNSATLQLAWRVYKAEHDAKKLELA